jgi:hypothetical protein
MRISLLLLILAISPGCATTALKRAALAQAGSSGDLRYKEAMENLAMIASNPDLLPAYSSIFAGTADITDTLKGTPASVWARTALKPFRYATYFSTQSADFSGTRAVKGTWSLDPTVVPEKLRAMHAACRWVILGPERVGPNITYLMAYDGHEAGYYFDVRDRLDWLQHQPAWLHYADRRIDIPHNACYWAGCGGKFVWVGPDGMASLSEFVLVLQKIARADFGTLYFPRTQTRSIQKDFVFSEGGKNFVATATINVDEEGRLTSGPNMPAVPLKARTDNIGLNADLKSVINATAKSP